MSRYCRGTALVETSLTIGIVLIVLFGTLQFGILGFMQTADDGAAFVAAHTYAQNPARGTSYAATTANGVFNKVPGSAITVTTQGGIVTATAATTSDGIGVPGAPATVALQSSDAERIPSAAGATPGGFAVTAMLKNYRDASGIANSSHPLGIAQTQRTGNGHNGRFAEWYCRQASYSGISFPSQRPTGSGAGRNTFWDPSWFNSPLAQVYAWDYGTTCT